MERSDDPQHRSQQPPERRGGGNGPHDGQPATEIQVESFQVAIQTPAGQDKLAIRLPIGGGGRIEIDPAFSDQLRFRTQRALLHQGGHLAEDAAFERGRGQRDESAGVAPRHPDAQAPFHHHGDGSQRHESQKDDHQLGRRPQAGPEIYRAG